MGGHPKKRLIVCLDGTWNGRQDGMPTNIARTANSLAHRGADGVTQIVCYLPGVGSSYRTDRIIGGLTGIGLRQQILTAYRFLSTNYEDGDEVYLFGFSRGAYAVRSLANLLEFPGLPGPLPDGRLYDYLFGLYQAACRAHRDKTSPVDARVDVPSTDLLRPPTGRLQYLRRHPKVTLAHGCERLQQLLMTRHTNVRAVDVRFLGVYDTVGALGFGDNKSHTLDLGPSVACARHALAIDDRRIPFRPELWTTSSETSWLADLRTILLPNPKHDTLDTTDTSDTTDPDDRADGADGGEQRPRVLQVWFRGVHSDVGGGAGGGPTLADSKYNALSGMPWLWLLREASLAGLGVDYHLVAPEIFLAIGESNSKPSPMYWASNGAGRMRQRLRGDNSFTGVDRVLAPPEALNVRIASPAVRRYYEKTRKTSWGEYKLVPWHPRGVADFEHAPGFDGYTEHVATLPADFAGPDLLKFIPPELRLAAGDSVERDRENAEHWEATAALMEANGHPRHAQRIRDRLRAERERAEQNFDW
jgi:hypothetical protein